MPKKWDVVFHIKLDVPKFDSLLSAIESVSQNLINLPLPPAALERLMRLNIIRAIRGTTGIEGNTMSEEAVGRAVAQLSPAGAMTVEERENVNANAAMEYIVALQTTRPPIITEELIKRVHLLMTDGIPNAWNDPGKYRRDAVFADNFEFPSPEKVTGLMRDFIKFINGSACIDLSPLIRALVAHFYLASIHPFGDGNGRVARALEAYLIYHSDFRAAGFYSLANFYYENRREYIDCLDQTRLAYDGDITAFVNFALNGFLTELAGLVKLGVPYLKVIKYGQHLDQMVINGELDQRVGSALKLIAETENGVSPREFVSRIPVWAIKLYRGKSERTLRNDLTRMRQSGLIEEHDGRIFPNLSVIEES